MSNLKCRSRGFTLAELVIVCSMFAAMVLGIILAINRAFVFMDNTRLSVRATNFAREGVEMVYNIRDTNWRKYSGEKDKYWMKIGTGNGLFTGGIYVIKQGTGGNIYAEFLTGSNSFYSAEGFFGSGNESYRNRSKILFTGIYSYYSGGSVVTGRLENLVNVGGLEFYRILRVYGVYCKRNGKPDQVVNASNCGEFSDPKELRFCVKVLYQSNGGNRSSELCSLMTNFME